MAANYRLVSSPTPGFRPLANGAKSARDRPAVQLCPLEQESLGGFFPLPESLQKESPAGRPSSGYRRCLDQGAEFLRAERNQALEEPTASPMISSGPGEAFGTR